MKSKSEMKKVMEKYDAATDGGGYLRNGFWDDLTKEECLAVLRHVIEDKLKWSWEDVILRPFRPILKQYKFLYFIDKYYRPEKDKNGNPNNKAPGEKRDQEKFSMYQLIRDLYPKLTLKEIYDVASKNNANLPVGVWVGEGAKERGLELFRYIVEKKYKWDFDTMRRNITKSFFIENCLGGFYESLYKHVIIQIIKDAYPDKEFTCLYCGKPLEDVTRKQLFCNPSCKAMDHQYNKGKANVGIPKTDEG